jgi:hypothetical protein
VFISFLHFSFHNNKRIIFHFKYFFK